MITFGRKILTIDGNVFAFISATFLSVSVNIYTGIFASTELPERYTVLLICAATSAISAWYWGRLSWLTTGWQRAQANRPHALSEVAVTEALAEKYGYGKIAWLFSFALMFGIVCILTLPIGVKSSPSPRLVKDEQLAADEATPATVAKKAVPSEPSSANKISKPSSPPPTSNSTPPPVAQP